jgi:glycine/D-amino acid oxidase-like deaminating enzyme/nitrite reductase/ring-hydroxylating ferredoxin subunit
MAERNIPEVPESYWRESIEIPRFDALKEDIKVDVAVVGGGITGIISAYLLINEGLSVALVEADRLLNGTTGHTTAKISAQHGLMYDELIKHMGKTHARLYYEVNDLAIDFIERCAESMGIDCEFKREDAFIYATTDKYARDLEKEYKAYKTLGISGELTDNIPFNINVKNVLSMKNQAQFHPLKFLVPLLKAFVDKGGKVYENTVAVDVEKGHIPTVITREGNRVTCQRVLACSHFPFYEWQGLYFTRMYVERAYVLAAKVEKDYPGGMYLSAENPTRSLRSVNIDGEEMVLIVGENHKTGQGIDTQKHYENLYDFGENVLGIKEVKYKWSAQDLYTLDKVPYIGEITAGYPDVLVATGYKKWGMTTSVVAAHIMRDILLKRDNKYRHVFSPSRFYADPSLKQFLTLNGDVAKHLIKGKFDIPERSLESLSGGEGAVVLFNGRRAGAFKNEDGELHIVDTTCTHMGCELEWNSGDRTWDCPCHGSRFSFKGEVMEGPAEKPLERLE